VTRPTPRRPAPEAASRAAPPAAVPVWPSLAVGAAALACYLAWCPRAPGDKDSPEFALVLSTLGLSHPTGYPLYTLLGAAFVRAAHAAGATWAFAANAWSAVGGAVAIGLLHALATHLLAGAGVRSRLAPLAVLPAVAAFALGPAWTYEATLAEVTSWHVAWAAGAALFAATRLARTAPRGRALLRDAALWGLLCGAGLAHHRTSVWVLAPLTLALLVRLRPAGAGAWLAALAGALVPLASYGYVAWRASHPAAVQWPALAPGAVWEFTSGAGYAHFLGRFAPSEAQRALLARDVFPWLVPALAAALAWPFARGATPRALRVAFAAAVLAQAAQAFFYGVPDPASYFLAPLALGLALVPALLAGLPPARRLAAPLAVAAALAVLAAGRDWPRVAVERAATFGRFDALTRSMWAAIPREHGFVIWEDDMWYRLLAYQRLEGVKPGLVVVNPVTLRHPLARRAFAARHGFDPLAGLPPAAAAVEDTEAELEPLRAAVVEALARTGEPVMVFLPQVPSVRLLREGGVAAAR
jgi:hypothetical protein